MKEETIMRPLTDQELRTIHGGGWFGDLIKWFKEHLFVTKEFDQAVADTYPDYHGHTHVGFKFKF